MNKRTWKVMLALISMLALVAASCSSSSTDTTTGSGDEDSDTTSAEGEAAPELEGEPIVVGMIGDATGPTSDVGVSYIEGQRGYVEYINANGGAGGREIDLVWQDYQYDVAVAEQLYEQYTSEGAVAFMGWGTGDTEALKERITEDEIPFISASLSEALADPSETPYNFLPAATYSEQIRVALKHIADEGGSSVAVFHNDSPFGTSPLADAEKYIADEGLDIEFQSIAMPGGVTDFVGQITQAGDVDYVIIQNVPSPAATLVNDLVSSGNDAQVICLNWCGNEVLVELAGDNAEGVLAVQPFLAKNSGAEGLADIQATGGDDVQIGYIHGWFAMQSMISAIGDVVESGDEVTGPAIKEALESQKLTTGGISADISYSADSHAGMSGAPIQVVTDGEWTPFKDVIVP